MFHTCEFSLFLYPLLVLTMSSSWSTLRIWVSNICSHASRVLKLRHCILAAAYAATIIISRPNVSLYDPVLKGFGLAGWALDLAVNVSVTAVISVRLWYMGMKVTTLTTGGAHATSSPNRFTVPIFTIIESGALFATVTIVMMIMYCRGSPLTLAAMDIATQLAVC